MMKYNKYKTRCACIHIPYGQRIGGSVDTYINSYGFQYTVWTHHCAHQFRSNQRGGKRKQERMKKSEGLNFTTWSNVKSSIGGDVDDGGLIYVHRSNRWMANWVMII